MGLGASLAAPVWNSLAVARMILSGLLDEVPTLRLIVTHLGGVLPYLAQRIDEQSSPGDAQHEFSYYLRERLYVDTCSYHHPALLAARASTSADALLLGSDFPFRGGAERAVTDVRTSTLSQNEQHTILVDNAVRLLGR